MGKKDKGLKKAALQVNPVVVEFVEAAAVGDVKSVKKIAKSGNIEIDDGEKEGVAAAVGTCFALICMLNIRQGGLVGPSERHFWGGRESAMGADGTKPRPFLAACTTY